MYCNSFHFDAKYGFLQFEVVLLQTICIIVQTCTVVVLINHHFSSTGRLKPQLQEPETEDQSTLFDGGLLVFIPLLLFLFLLHVLIHVHCTFNILTLVKQKRGVCSKKMFCKVLERSKSIFKDSLNDIFCFLRDHCIKSMLYVLVVVSLTNIELKLFCLSYSLTHHCLSFCLLVCLFTVDI